MTLLAAMLPLIGILGGIGWGRFSNVSRENAPDAERRLALAAAGLLLAAALAAAGAWGPGGWKRTWRPKGAGGAAGDRAGAGGAVLCAGGGRIRPALPTWKRIMGCRWTAAATLLPTRAFAPNLLPDVTVLQKGG